MTFESVELSPNSRISIHDNPNSAPGKCCMCGDAGSNDRKFVDFGMQLDWYGAVYFCTQCLVEIAQAIGFVEVEVVDEISKRYNIMSTDFNKIQRAFKELKDATRSILRDCACGDSLPDAPSGDSSSVAVSEEPARISKRAAQVSSSSNKSSGFKGLGNVQWTGDDEE